MSKVANVQSQLERLVEKNYYLNQSARDAYRSYVLAYNSHQLKDIFNVHRLDMAAIAKSFGFSSPPRCVCVWGGPPPGRECVPGALCQPGRNSFLRPQHGHFLRSALLPFHPVPKGEPGDREPVIAHPQGEQCGGQERRLQALHGQRPRLQRKEQPREAGRGGQAAVCADMRRPEARVRKDSMKKDLFW